MLSIGGQGMLLNAVHPCWIVQVLSRGTVMAVLCKGVPSVVVFEILPSHEIGRASCRERVFNWV